ncbi:MAG: hypothetical protein ACI8PZ_001380 [Myxococcota bacterium]|jgi:hypothetical protein
MTALLGLLLLAPAWGHSMWPASLTLVEAPGGLVSVSWEVPVRGGRPLPIHPVLPAHCEPTGAPWFSQNSTVRQVERQVDCGEQGIEGAQIGVEGLARTQSDVLLVIEHADGRTTSDVLRFDHSSMVVPRPGAEVPTAGRYFAIGVEHIGSGVDHVLFVIGLVLIAGVRWSLLLKTVTAFTVAHSATLALSTLGWVRFPSASVEAVIALSILLLAVEATRPREASLTARYPWAVAGGCGLIHGLGFAGALAKLGLPQGHVPLALLNFNLGVEAGQLVVVAGALVALAIARRLQLPTAVRLVPVYVVGSVAAYWFIQRAVSIVGV